MWTKSIKRVLLGVACLATVGLVQAMSEEKVENKTDPKLLQAFATETNQFGFDLFQQLRQKPGNLFISPYSISSALAMTAAGARGTTAEQMTKVLHLPGEVDKYAGLEQGLMSSILDKPKGYDIRIANALWGQQQHPFKPEYIGLVQRTFRAEARSMDFAQAAEASRQTINQWVEAQTNNRITNLLPSGSVTPDTKMVLTNAIFFKGKWKSPFDKKQTKSENFYASGKTAKAEMMHRRTNMLYSENDQLQMVELPYEGDRLSMVVILPKQKDGLGDVEASLSAVVLTNLLNKHSWQDVILTLPKLKTTYSATLAKTLSGMGMSSAFDTNADFSGMDGTRELCITDVVHKAFCEINEEGTEAAAATGVLMAPMAAVPQTPPPPKVFQADHPYLYLIRDTQTGSILFLGRVSQPE